MHTILVSSCVFNNNYKTRLSQSVSQSVSLKQPDNNSPQRDLVTITSSYWFPCGQNI